MFTQESGSTHGLAYINFSCLFENKGLIKITGSHVPCKWY